MLVKEYMLGMLAVCQCSLDRLFKVQSSVTMPSIFSEPTGSSEIMSFTAFELMSMFGSKAVPAR